MVGNCWDCTPHVEKVLEGIEKGLDLRPTNQLTSTDWYAIPDSESLYYYAIAGSWVTYLINTFGIDPFRNLYIHTNREMNKTQIEESYKTYLGAPLSTLEESYFIYFKD